jgi:thiol-disulfide isomerase/thioredoxin
VIGGAVAPDKADAKTIFVLDFWATWCPPCRRSTPFLNELAERYKNRGVVVAGISAEDEATIVKFAQEMKVTYPMAADDRGATTKAYLADDAPAIPQAFVVKGGVIIWTGHPMAGLDKALDQILAGTYDPQKSTKLAAAKAMLRKATKEGDMDRVLMALDQLMKLQPEEYSYVTMKVDALREKNDTAGILKTREAAAKSFAKSSESLNNLAWDIVTDPDLAARDLRLALQCAEDAVRLANRKEAASLDTLARACYELGLLDEAMSIQKEAIVAAQGAEERNSVNAAMKYYEQVKAVRAERAARK